MFERISQSWYYYLKSLPFLYKRMVLYSLLSAAASLYIITLLTGSTFFDDPLFEWGFIMGGGVLGFMMFRSLSATIRYRIWLSHMAIVADLLRGKAVPFGVDQVRLGRQQMKRIYPSKRYFLVLGKTVGRTVQGLNSRLVKNKLSPILDQVAFLTLPTVQSLVLAFALLTPQQKPLESVRKGLLTYSKFWNKNLQMIFFHMVMGILGWSAFLIVLLPPTFGFISLFPAFQLFFLVLAIIVAFVLKEIVVSPYLSIYMLISFSEMATSVSAEMVRTLQPQKEAA
jgi:hypothetical protein